jgi:hypothetical protein
VDIAQVLDLYSENNSSPGLRMPVYLYQRPTPFAR